MRLETALEVMLYAQEKQKRGPALTSDSLGVGEEGMDSFDAAIDAD